jgi:hypothetical protein
MTETERKPDDVVSYNASQDTKSPPESDDISQLLAEFDAKTAQPAEPATDGNVSDNVSADELDRLIADLSQPSPDQQRITELTGQVDSLRAEEFRRGELAAFNEMAEGLQQAMPSWAPPDYAEMRLKALAHDQIIALAWELRNVDKVAAQFELTKVTREFLQLKQDPAADPKRVQELQQYGARLEIAISANAILRKARLDIINEAAKLKPPYDPDATQIHMDVAAAVRGASAPLDLKEPEPEYGKLSASEGRQLVKAKYGFDPGWGG